ncbi:MAG: hypothetical protein IJO88_03080 [Oscillospiraceae bacterium]|nr:hypothetical protein [Oscillospiraceae bacterium]
MKTKKIRIIGAACVLALWLALTVLALTAPQKALSEAERRPLAQIPDFGLSELWDGSFMKDFEKGAMDQFPLRDSFRKFKALFHYYGLRQSDNNGVYLAEGHAAKLLYPMDKEAVALAIQRLDKIYEKYLKDTGSNIYAAVIPDKSCWLGDLALDYDAFFSAVEAGMPWAEHISLTDVLTVDDYYKTDIHWRQEALLPAAKKLAQAMGMTLEETFTETVLDRPFYGVYHGQAALPMAAETMVLMESESTKNATVYDHESGKTVSVYDLTKLESKDLYDVFLSGSRSLLTIENAKAKTEKELIVFRDSFASSMIPLLLENYRTVTLVDIRYMSSEVLGNFIDFHGQDVLFLYSTTVLNTKGILK